MLFNSLQFLIFFPIVLLVYYIIPDRVKYIWLLIASYYFYMCWNAKYALLILFSTVITYLSGILMERINASDRSEEKRVKGKKACVALSMILNLGVLGVFKYTGFALGTLTKVFALARISLNVPAFDIVLPVGISFYTFQALSYTMDIYRGEIRAEKNFLRYALFVSFFPQLVAGPIERSKNLLKQLAVPSKFDYNRAVEGFLLMLWGYFMKVVVADRTAVFVDSVYNDHENFGGMYLIVACVLFAFQIYCDFGGYSCIAMGSAKILGVELMENFNTPYLALSVGDFWRRWHISLTGWFRDYLYIPLGGNRRGKVRKFINKLIVFLVSGLWHGAAWSFVAWGGLHGLYQITGELLDPIRHRFEDRIGLKRDTTGYKMCQILVTFVLTDFAWIFFRAQSMDRAVAVIRSIFTLHNSYILFDGSLYGCGLDEKNFHVMLISIAVLIVADIFKYKGIVLRKWLMEQDWLFRAFAIAASITLILIFGIWGGAYDQASFIYFQF